MKAIAYLRVSGKSQIEGDGFPPPHLDADGDFKPDPEPEEEE